MTMRSMAWCAALALLAGCAVGPDYKTPESTSPDAWSQTPDGGAHAAAADLTRWWTSLGDDQLNVLIDRAVGTNLDLRIAEARVREARALRGVASADFWPEVDVDGSYARSRVSEHGAPGGFHPLQDSAGSDLYQIGFDASWEIDVFGRVRRSVEAADADIAAAVQSRRDVLVSLLSEVARNYVEARSFQNRLVIARDNIRSQQENVDLTKARFQAGLGTDLDVARAEAQLAATTSQVPVLETGIKQSVHRLGVLVGQMPGSLLAELESTEPIPPIPPDVPVGLPSDLLRRRPDIRRSERELAAATARIGEATADLFPRFSLTGTFGFASTQIGSLPSGDSRFWSIGPAVRWPIFEAGRIQSNIRVQDARQEQALARYEQTVLVAFEDVENALVAYGREQVRRRSLTEAVDANKRAVEMSNELYTRGLTDFLSVIDAQRSLYLSQDQLVQSNATVTENLIALYKSLGGGWESFEPPPPSPESDQPATTPPPPPVEADQPAVGQ